MNRTRTSVPKAVGRSSIIRCTEKAGYRYRVLMGTATLGVVRIEWHDAINALIMPCNWGMAKCTPLNFHVDDAQNLIVKTALDAQCEWVWFVEDDTIPPPDACLRFHEWIRRGDVPVVSGLYRLKGGSGEPLVYRGVGTGAYTDWKPGERVWADGVPTGCLLVHSSLLRVMWDTAEDYEIAANGQKVKLKRVFENPRSFVYDPVSGAYQKNIGTSDLEWCHRVMREGVLKEAGWGKVAKRRWPFLVDTRINCGHIDRDSGVVW